MSEIRPLKALKQRYRLDSDQAGNAKGHIYVTTAGLVILEKITDAVLAGSLSWGQATTSSTRSLRSITAR